MEPIRVKCPICEEKSNLKLVSKGQTVHRCKACKNLVKIVECKTEEFKEAAKEVMKNHADALEKLEDKKEKPKKKKAPKKKTSRRKKKSDEK